MERARSAPRSPCLDEDTFMAVVNDVWDRQSPPTSPLVGPELLNTKEPKKKRRRDRNRPWHEIARLQAEAEELEQELDIQLALATKRARSSFNTHVQNAQLKKLLCETIEDTRALELNLNKQIEELVHMLPRSVNMMPRNLPYDTAQDDVVFRKMAQCVDEQYNEMERVLRLAGLDGANSEVVDAFFCRSKSEASGDLLKSRTRTLSPFQSCSLLKALWKNVESDESATLRTKQAARKLGLPVGRASRIAVQKYEVVVGDYVCTMRMVMKQFIEKDRVTQVWNSVADWPLVGGMHNVQTHEQGWGFIQPMNESTSLCMNYSLMNPKIEAAHNEAQFKFLARLYQNMIISRLHMLESQTLDQAMTGEEDHSEVNSSKGEKLSKVPQLLVYSHKPSGAPHAGLFYQVKPSKVVAASLGSAVFSKARVHFSKVEAASARIWIPKRKSKLERLVDISVLPPVVINL